MKRSFFAALALALMVVSATAAVAGAEADTYVLFDFNDPQRPVNILNHEEATAAGRYVTDPVVEGSHSFYLEYVAPKWVTVTVYPPDGELWDLTGYKKLQMWVYGDGSESTVELHLLSSDRSGSGTHIFTYVLDFQGWKLLEFPLSEVADTLWPIRGVRIAGSRKNTAISVYYDLLQAVK